DLPLQGARREVLGCRRDGRLGLDVVLPALAGPQSCAFDPLQAGLAQNAVRGVRRELPDPRLPGYTPSDAGRDLRSTGADHPVLRLLPDHAGLEPSRIVCNPT